MINLWRHNSLKMAEWALPFLLQNPSPLETIGVPSVSFQKEQSLFSRDVPWQGQTLNSGPRIDVEMGEGTEAMSYTYISCLRGTLHMVFALCSQCCWLHWKFSLGAHCAVCQKCHFCESGLQTIQCCTCSWPRKLLHLKMLGRYASCHPQSQPNGSPQQVTDRYGGEKA